MITESPPSRAGLLAAAGLIAAVLSAGIILVVPLHASFGDDPVLRLQGFDRQRSFLATTVDCGPVSSNLTEPAGIRTVYEVARDDACHRAGLRRFWLAVAAAATLAAATFLSLVAAAERA